MDGIKRAKPGRVTGPLVHSGAPNASPGVFKDGSGPKQDKGRDYDIPDDLKASIKNGPFNVPAVKKGPPPPQAFARKDAPQPDAPKAPKPSKDLKLTLEADSRAKDLLQKLKDKGSLDGEKSSKALLDDSKPYKDLRNKKQQRAYNKLSTKARQEYKDVYTALATGESESAKLAGAGLRKLLANGGLKAKDSTGERMIDILAKRLNQPLPDKLAKLGLDGATQLREIVEAAAFPEYTFQGEGTTTCVSASLETILAKQKPGELARIATGLMWEGSVPLANGATLAFNGSELGKDDSGRGSLHQIVQGSLNAHGEAKPPYPEGQSPEDEFGGGRYRAGGTFGAGTYGETQPAVAPTNGATPVGGLTEFQAEALFKDVLGASAVGFDVKDENRDLAWSMVEASVASGLPTSIGVATTDALGAKLHHRVTVTRIEGDKVWIADSGVGEETSVPKAQIKADLEGFVVPNDLVADFTSKKKSKGHYREVETMMKNVSARYGKPRPKKYSF